MSGICLNRENANIDREPTGSFEGLSLPILNGMPQARQEGPKEELRHHFAKLLRNLPVSINGSADPALMRESTEQKMEMLIADKHTGPVSLVTKGCLDTEWWRPRLARWAKHLDLYVFASISGLPKSYEPAPLEPRFRTLRAARQAGAQTIAYIRPIIPGLNDTPEILRSLAEKSAAHGCHAIVSSGFRGDPKVVDSSGFGGAAQDGKPWFRSVKLMPKSGEEFLRATARELGVGFWTGTACAVAALRGEERSIAPYHLAPQFGGCTECDLKATCFELAAEHEPLEHSIELLRYLGYQVEFHGAKESVRNCEVQIRSECDRQCTTCPTAPSFGVPYITLKRWDGSEPSAGDLYFARFLTGGILVPDEGPGEEEIGNIALHPRFRFPDGKNGEGQLFAAKSWMMWSEFLPKEDCFNCSYCFLSMYENQVPPHLQGTIGISPVRVLGQAKAGG